MPLQISSSSSESGLPTSSRPVSYVYWYAVAIGSLYLFLIYLFIEKVVPIFVTLFVGLGVDLPLPTRLLMTAHSWLFPVAFLSGAVLATARRFLTLDKLQRRIFDVFLIFLGLVIVPLAILVLYLPLFELIHKLAGAH